MREISEKAVWSRVNRQLARSGEVLKKSRGVTTVTDFGKWYILDISRNTLIDRDVDLEALARGMAVIGEHEFLREV